MINQDNIQNIYSFLSKSGHIIKRIGRILELMKYTMIIMIILVFILSSLYNTNSLVRNQC